jgi:hypothetical protein
MSDDQFDIKKLRRRWDLAVPPDVRGAPPGWLAGARAPLDPFVAARHELGRVRELVRSQVSREVETVEQFLARVEAAIGALEAASSPAAEGSAAPEAEDPALRAELDDALFDLEDILEVFTMVTR